jgi:hypothetical protein
MKAFPNEGFNGWGEPEQGMDLRDWFAGQALTGILANPTTGDDLNAISKASYQLANYMMKAREDKND